MARNTPDITTDTPIAALPGDVDEIVELITPDVIDPALVRGEDWGSALLQVVRERGHVATVGDLRDRLYRLRLALLDVVVAVQTAMPLLDAEDARMLDITTRWLRRRVALD